MSRSISFSAIDSPGGGGVSTEEPSHHVGLCSSSPPVAPRHQHLHLHQQQHHYHHHHPNTQRIPLVNSPDLQLRFLSPSDLPEVKRLCKEWFPIDYPDAWYNDITSNAKFYAVACVYHNRIIGLVVSEIKDYFKLPKEDSELLATTFRQVE